MVENLPNPIEEYFDKNSKKSDFLDLFEAKEDNVDLRTDLTISEINLVNVIQLQGELAYKLGLKDNIHKKFINGYKRLKVSLDRKSRAEFVDINKKERFENNLQKFNAFKTLQDTKQ